MDDKFNLEIEGFGLINEAKIEINKINVVGGVNASGKSTASKLLYCFLRANSPDIKEYVLTAILPTINKFINIMEHENIAGLDLPYKYTVEDDIKTILNNYSDAEKIYKKLSKEDSFIPYEDMIYDMKYRIDKFIPFLTDKKNSKNYSSIIKSLFGNESLLNFEGQSTFYDDSFKCFVSYKPNDDMILSIIDRYYELSKIGISSDDFDDVDDTFIYSTEGSFNSQNKIFYIDSISYLDLNFYLNDTLNKDKELFGYKEHVEYILKHLDSYEIDDNLSEDIKEKMNHINELISNIIKGHVYKISENLSLNDNMDYHFTPKDSENKYDVISSGIQQISLIQILLDKYKLQPGTFLIIDEPEVNLHPEWQFKFAEILVLLAKELDINIYLNSHSPMFIEAMEVLTQYYDLEEDTNFYLTEKHDENTYDFVKIEYDNLYEIYDNLAKPFDAIEVYRLKNEYKKGNY